MTETLPDPPELDPAALAGTHFGRTRRGFEPAEVHATLGRAADSLRAWQLRDAQLRARIEELEQALTDAQRLDEQRLTTVLGEETARIVAAARDAANDIRANAEEQAARLLRETSDEATSAAEAMKGEAAALRDEAAKLRDDAAADATRVRSDAEADAERIRSEAEASAAALVAEARATHDRLLTEAQGVLAERTSEAEQAAAEITAAASAEREAAASEAEQTRSRTAAESAEILDAARTEGRSMVTEAKALRERILRDLVERRGTARRQIEGARAGRDQIVAVLRATIDEVSATIDHLGDVEAEAGAAATDAAAAVAIDTDAEVAELLVELGEDPTVAVEESAPAPARGPDVDAGADVRPERAAEAGDEATSPPADEPGPTGDEPAHDAASAEDTASADDEVADDEVAEEDDAPGATVHDLFARIRAEGMQDDDPSARGDEHDVEPVAVGSDIDLTAPGAIGDSEGQVAVLHGAPPAEQSDPQGEGAAPAVAVATSTTGSELLDRRDELLAPVEKSLSRVLRRLASDEQNEMLDQLRRAKRGRPDRTALLPEGGDNGLARFVDALAPDFGRAAEAGATFWAEVAGSSADPLFGDDELLRERLVAGVTGFLDLHRAHLERTFSDAEAEGLDATDLADRVRAAYRDWRSGSLADLAGDLATAGFAHGERRAAGPGTPWRWVVDHGGLPCADGEDNALAGAVPCDEPFPTGDVTPPAHPGCRCILAPAHQ